VACFLGNGLKVLFVINAGQAPSPSQTGVTPRGGKGNNGSLKIVKIVGICLASGLLVLIVTALILKCGTDRRAAKEDEKFIQSQQAIALDHSASVSHASDFSGIAPTDRDGRPFITTSASVKSPKMQPPLKAAKSGARSTGAHTSFPARGTTSTGAGQRSTPPDFSDSRLNPFWGTGGGAGSAFAGDSASQGTGASDSLFATPNQPAGSFAPPTPPTESPGQHPGVIGNGRSNSSECSDLTSVLSDSSVVSRSLSKVKVSGNARRASSAGSGPTLPSASNNYPHSEELSKMTSREIHKRMRSPGVSGPRKTSVHKTPVLTRSSKSATPVAPEPAPEAAPEVAVEAGVATRAAASALEIPSNPTPSFIDSDVPQASPSQHVGRTSPAPMVSVAAADDAAGSTATAAASDCNMGGMQEVSDKQQDPQASAPSAAISFPVAAAEEKETCLPSMTAPPAEVLEERPEAGYVAAAMAAAAVEPEKAKSNTLPPPSLPTPPRAMDGDTSVRGDSCDTPGASPPINPVLQHESGVIEERNGIALQYFSTRRVRPVSGSGQSSGISGLVPTSDTTARLAPSFADGIADGHGDLSMGISSAAGATRGMHGDGDTVGISDLAAGGDMAMGMTAADAAMAEGGDSTALSDKSQAMSISSFTSVSVVSESTTVYTNIGYVSRVSACDCCIMHVPVFCLSQCFWSFADPETNIVKG
jgi:hypothetical protein